MNVICILLCSNKLTKTFFKFKVNEKLSNLNNTVSIYLLLKNFNDKFYGDPQYEYLINSREDLIISLSEEVDEKFNNFNNIKCNSIEECEEVLKIIIELIEKKEFVKSFFAKTIKDVIKLKLNKINETNQK